MPHFAISEKVANYGQNAKKLSYFVDYNAIKW
jgi:hypothetical protein